MQTLTNSAFLQALGYALANSLWQMAILWIVYVIVSHVIKLSAANKYRVAAGLQLTGFAWFIGTLQFYYAQCSSMAAIARTETQQNITLIIPEGGDTFRSQLLCTMIKAEQVLPYLSVAYLALFVILSIRWIKCYRYTQKLRTQGLHKADIDLKLFVKKIAAHLGIKQEVKVYVSELVKSPLTVGFLKPIILIPLANINQLTTEQMEAVLLHELAHIKRFDYLLNLLLTCIETVLFFNPFTLLLSKAIKKERENSCDDWVLQFQYNPTTYAEALLRIAYLQQSTPAMAMAALGDKNDLLSRIKRMVGQKEKKFNYRQQLAALLLMTFIMSSLAWFNPEKNAAQQPKNIITAGNNQAVVLEPMAAKVKNPLFNPMFFMQKPLQEEVQQNVAAVNKEWQEADEAIANAHKEIAKAIPTAIKSVQSVDWKSVSQEINCSIEDLKTELPLAFSELEVELKEAQQAQNIALQEEKEWKKYLSTNELSQVNADLKKASAEMDKVFGNKKFFSTKEGLQVKAELRKAFAEIKKISIPFVSQSALQALQQSMNTYSQQLQLELNEACRISNTKQRADSIKAATLTLRKNNKTAARAKTPTRVMDYCFSDAPLPPAAPASPDFIFSNNYNDAWHYNNATATANTTSSQSKQTTAAATARKATRSSKGQTITISKTTSGDKKTPRVQIVIETDEDEETDGKQITIEVL